MNPLCETSHQTLVDPAAPPSPKMSILRKWAARAIACTVILLGLIFFAGGPILDHMVPNMAERVRAALNEGGALLDREGRLLRLFPDPAGNFRLTRPTKRFPRLLRAAMLIAEDRRFFRHGGFDPLAIARAAWQNLTHRRVISGASTITQQLIRLVRPRPRTLLTKCSELILAAALERRMSKTEILTAYLNLAPTGANLRGAALASLLWFGKDMRRLSPAEAAVIAAFPQSPTRLDPRWHKGRKRLMERRDRILRAMREYRVITDAQLRLGLEQPLPTKLRPLSWRAMHFVEWCIKQDGPPIGERVTALDLGVQGILERAVRAHRIRLSQSGATQVCGVVADARTLEVLAMMGSIHYGPVAGGFINGCERRRSGGSILKPFLYALALEHGFTAASSIPDTKQHFRTPQGDYLPENADRRAYGPVTLRSGLGNSLNIAAVKLLNALGIREFSELLVSEGILASSTEAIETYGLGMAIGNPEVRMVDLVAGYGSFAHGGQRVHLRTTPGPLITGQRLFSAETAFIILDILSDPSARMLTFGNPRFFQFSRPTAFKTGSSTNYRDAWLIAVTREHIIALWAGNFDGRPTFGLSGAVACGPILHDLLGELEAGDDGAWYARPANVVVATVCGISGGKPTPFCPVISHELFVRGTEDLPLCAFHTRPGATHELPPEYADWIERRRERHIPDPFALTGGLYPINPLEAGELPRLSPGINILPASGSAIASASPEAPVTNTPSEATGTILIRSRADTNDFRSAGRISIVSPHTNDRFVMIPGDENLTILRAVPTEPVPELIWLIDGVEFARTPPPYTAVWKLRRGRHIIGCIGPGEESAQITIDVE
ncbi:MAG: transglycosylase domain-containing protein [Candidatus Riflebacteria bacterium]|nr:transglycosylase domain-containing protein [Candidatus Riflebacteria bacterium]